MLLAVDIGNSNIKFGVFEDGEIRAEMRLRSDRKLSGDQIGERLLRSLSQHQIHAGTVAAVIVSSVVPELDAAVASMARTVFGTAADFVDHTFDFGIAINYHPKSSIGSDRLIDAFAAVNKYGSPCIVCDFGTATTIDAVSSNNEFLGGIIAPGMQTIADSLTEKTSKLPNVNITRPDTVLGSSTVDSIRSGIYFGYIGLVDGLIRRMIGELGEDPKIISTGGFAGLIAEESEYVEIIDNQLLLDGLRLVYERNRVS